MSRTTSSTIVPAVPVVPATPAKPEPPAKTKKGKQPAKVPEAVEAVPGPSLPATPTKPATKSLGAKVQDTNDSTGKTVADVVAKKSESKEKKSTPETPAKTATKGKAANKKVDKAEKVTEASVHKSSVKDSADDGAATDTSASTKRQHPGKLDIPAAKMIEKEPVSVATPSKMEKQTNDARAIPTAPSVPASPAVGAAPSPVKHTAAPRTLRLVSTPKVETPPAAPTPPLPHLPTVDKLRSRQASIASLNQPGTPASELISDTASMTSGMVSRASSPPPASSIVGSAPVRKVTKAQAKKNRQERKRQEEEKEKAEAGSDVEVVQAPIIGRKKKAKKPNTTPKPVAAMASAMKEAAAKSQPASPKSATVEDEPLETPTVASVKAQSARNSASATPEPEPQPQPEDTKERREPSAQSVLNDLQKTGDLLVSALEFFKPVSSGLTHGSRTTSSGQPTLPPDLKIHFSEADLDALARKIPVHIDGQDGKPDSRTLITPSGKFLWGLTAELEERALYLESEIEKLTGYLRFHPTTRSSPSHPYSNAHVLPALATALKEAAVPKKLPHSPSNSLKFDSAMYSQQLPPVQPNDFIAAPVPVQQQTPADAGAYLNQFVLPATDNPPPNHPRPEMAAVGGAPGSGTTHISIQAGPGRHGEGFEKAARAVLEGGAVGSTEIEGIASMIGDKSGGVWVRGVEGLVGASLGMGDPREFAEIRKVLSDLEQEGYAMPSQSPKDQGTVDSLCGRHRDRRCVLGVEEAEAVMVSAKREQEALERKMGALVKRNKKLAMGNVR